MGILYITIFVFITIITSFSLSQVYAEPIIYDDDYTVIKFVTGLDYPTTMIFVGEDMLVLEKNTGKVIRIQDNGVIYSELVLDVPVIQAGELGLLGITFASNHAYLYFTESLSGFDKFKSWQEQAFHLVSTENARNVVFQYDWNGKKLTNPILIKELPALYTSHAGGVITKGLNNEIYFVIGDQYQSTIFQNIHADAIYETSSIFKIDTESNNSVELFAMGIRNSFGLAVDPITGYLWETENARDRFDEINLVKPRFNSGWISIMGPADRVDSDLSTLNPKPFENFVYSDPEFSWYVQVAPTAITFPDKDGFGKHSDSLFVGDFNNGRIYNFQLNLDRTGFVFSNPELSDLVLDDNDKIDEILFARDFQGVTDIKFHDGAMYVVAFVDGSIYKIYPKNILSPLKQYQSGVPHKKIVCKQSLMPIMSKTGYVYCVQPKTAITLIDVLNWSIDHPEMPKIELKNQDLQGLDFEYVNLSNSDFRGANFDTTTNISNANFARANLSHADLSGQDLTGTILTGADLSHTNLAGVDLSGKDLTGTRLVGVDLSGKDLTGTMLTGADLSDTNLDGVDLSGRDLTEMKLTGADMSGVNLSGAKLVGVDLSHTNLAGIDLSDMDLSNTNLDGADLSGNDLTGTILTGADLSYTNLDGVDLSGRDLTEMKLTGADMSNAILTDMILTGVDLSYTNLNGVDLSGMNLTGTMLSGANLTNAVLPNDYLSGNDFSNTIFDGVDLSGKDLSKSDFNYVSLKNTNLQNTNLSNTTFVQVDFTKVKNKSLAGADLLGAAFAHSNLSGVNLSDVILDRVNFWKADLSGLDFTVTSDSFIRGSGFIESILPNSNFEGVNLSPADIFTKTFKNKAYLIRDTTPSPEAKNTIKDLFGNYHMLIKSAKVSGNDLVVTYIFYNSFKGANLENANFKNASLWHANFYSADLTNADLSGADLSKTFLGSADLTNANLEGANLDGAVLDNAILSNANLKCFNHVICS